MTPHFSHSSPHVGTSKPFRCRAHIFRCHYGDKDRVDLVLYRLGVKILNEMRRKGEKKFVVTK